MDVSLDKHTDPNIIDVLVVGAGPVGLFCANELVRHGLRCRIIDKKSDLSVHSKALGIHIRTLDVLQDCDLLEPFLTQGLKVHGARIQSGNQLLASLDFKHIDASRDYLVDLPQNQSETILYTALTHKGVAVEWQSELTAMTQYPTHVDARIRQADGAEQTIQAQWIIACDGAHSTLRHLLAAEFVGSEYPHHWWLADLHIDWSLADDRMIIYPSSQGPLACFPMGNKRYRLVLTAPSDAVMPELADIQQAFQQRTKSDAVLSDPVWISPFSIHHRQIQQYRHERVFFCGDAAHIHSPLGGQGLNTGIQDAYNLVWKLALVQKRKAPDRLLDTYHSERYPVGQNVLRKTDVMTRMLLIKNPLLIALRNQMLYWLASVPGIRKRIARDLAELNIRYQNSLIVKSIGKKTGFKAGEYAPAMLLKNLHDRTHLSLDEICKGTKHHLFLFVGKQDNVTKVNVKASVLSQKFTDVLAVHIVLLDTPSIYPDSLSIWIDINQAIHQQFALDEPTALLVRPDKYTGLVQSPVRLVELQACLHALFIH